MDESVLSQVKLIREAFYYQSRFSGTTMVFKVDFPVTEDAAFPYLLRDMALLARSGIKVVIVPGAKERIDSVLKKHRIVSNYIDGARITPEAAIPFVEMASFQVASLFMTSFSENHIDAVIGNFVRARGLGMVKGTDMGRAGQVERVLAEPLTRIMELGMVPILPCIGWSVSGKSYNVPSDDIALAVSAALGAVKLFVISLNRADSSVLAIPDGIEAGDKGRIMRLTPKEAERLIKKNQHLQEDKKAGGKIMEGLCLALKAAQAGVERVHMVDGRENGAVLRELFSNLGSGTMVYQDEYESIRPLKAEDIPDVLRLMEPLMKRGILVRRNYDGVREKMSDYFVYEIDGSIHASAALHAWGEGQGEIAAVATDQAYSDLGIGRRMVGYCIDRAKKLRLRRVFALTTASHDWFESLGFKESSVGSLPKNKKRDYDQRRKSKVFALDL